MREPVNYIMHIPKTAGMSLQALVRRRYKDPQKLRLIYTQEQIDQGFIDDEEIEVVMGHFRFGYHRFSRRPYNYSVFLRDPVQQVISHYGYTLDHPEKFKDLPEGINNIFDFVSCPYGNNLQTRFISGIDNPSPETLYQAKVNLLKHFEVIGLTEEFDASILLLGKKLNWSIKFYTSENQGLARSKKISLTIQEMEKLRRKLKYDMELYEFGRRLFYNQLQKQPEIKRKLALYRLQNKIFKKANPLYIRFKQIFGMVKSELRG